MSTANVEASTPAGTGLAIGDLISSPAFEATVPAAESTAKTPVKKNRGRSKKAAEAEVASPAEGVDGDATPAEPTTPKPVTKRGRPTKAKVPATPNEDGEAPATAPKSSAKRGAAKTADGETPSKKPKAAPKTPKAAAAPKAGFPTCWEEFSEEDKLIVTMRRDKAAWQEIEAALEKITGNKPGKDVTRKKYAKLEAVATIFAPGDSARLAAAKVTIEGQIAESIKQLNLTKWAKIAEEMKNNGAGVYKTAALEKKFDNMVKNDEVDASGNYIGPDKTTTNGAAAAEGDEEVEAPETNGDTEMAEAEIEAEAEAEEEA